MTATTRHVYKLDDGESYPSRCFPIRTFLHHRKEGAGHWIVAHREDLKQHTYRNVHTDNKQQQQQHHVKCERHRGTARRPNSPDNSAGKVLDALFLMQLHGVDEPWELCSVNVSGQGLNSVKAEELKEFDSVAYIDASDNSLSLGFFSSFISLRELDLSLNGLSDMTFSAEDFPHLEIFDLSYNGVSASAIVSIGGLPRLRVLHLSGNKLRSLPADLNKLRSLPADLDKLRSLPADLDKLRSLPADLMASTSPPRHYAAALVIPDQEAGSLFGSLEVLMLDDNKLTSDVFSCLVNMRRLRYLNLQGNLISEIPYLHQKAGSKQHDKEQDRAHIESSPSELSKGTEADPSPQQQPSPSRPSRRDTTSEEMMIRWDWEHSSEGGETGRGDILPPLPELRFLNVADNKMAEEEALLPAALFPRLCEVVIHSNPLTARSSGDPPLLTRLLQERLGIQITRKKTPAVVPSPPLALRFDPKPTVEKAIPEMKPALCRFPPFGEQRLVDEQHVCEDYIVMMSALHAPPAKAGETTEEEEEEEEEEADVKTAPKNDGAQSGIHETCDDDAQSFFVTQPTDFLERTAEEAQSAGEAESDAIPEKCKKNSGYETLMNAQADPDAMEAAGIQPTIRMLKHALNNPIVYRDSRAKLDSLQSPYREQVKVLPAPCFRSTKKRHENVEEMLREMKESKSFIRGIPLSSVLEDRGPDNKHLYEDAVSLLRDLREKHHRVHEKRAEHATRLESTRESGV